MAAAIDKIFRELNADVKGFEKFVDNYASEMDRILRGDFSDEERVHVADIRNQSDSPKTQHDLAQLQANLALANDSPTRQPKQDAPNFLKCRKLSENTVDEKAEVENSPLMEPCIYCVEVADAERQRKRDATSLSGFSGVSAF